MLIDVPLSRYALAREFPKLLSVCLSFFDYPFFTYPVKNRCGF